MLKATKTRSTTELSLPARLNIDWNRQAANQLKKAENLFIHLILPCPVPTHML